MKIVIYNESLDLCPEIDDTTSLVSGVYTIRKLIKLMNPQDDIEGTILPDAKNNPEFEQILRAIYDHKKKRWLGGYGLANGNNPPHTVFAKAMLKKFNIILWKS